MLCVLYGFLVSSQTLSLHFCDKEQLSCSRAKWERATELKCYQVLALKPAIGVVGCTYTKKIVAVGQLRNQGVIQNFQDMILALKLVKISHEEIMK